MKIRKNKRAQEEMVGFVLIVVVVCVIFLVFLAISFRQTDRVVEQESKDIYMFLESIMEYTTGCAISYEPAYSKIGELIKECYENPAGACVSEEKACVVLNNTLKGIFDASWQVGADRPYKGYVFEVIYEADSKQERVILISKGECGVSFIGSEYLSSAFPGSLISSFKLCL